MSGRSQGGPEGYGYRILFSSISSPLTGRFLRSRPVSMSREERDMSLHCSSVASLKGIESTSCQWSEERAQRETKGSDMDGLESSPSLSRFSGFESFHLTFPLLTNDYNFRNLVSWLVLPFGANGWYLGSCMLPSHPRSWRSLGWVTQGMIVTHHPFPWLEGHPVHHPPQAVSRRKPTVPRILTAWS